MVYLEQEILEIIIYTTYMIRFNRNIKTEHAVMLVVDSTRAWAIAGALTHE